ncbi:condensation domain-containing protein [Micromonospora sp. DR5-3]|uniref:condensation domain-containing protein n=1 Tax=unclassified Micromonospora TaxID=2617518 RepID=UPI0011D8B695|nr:MULTISPECIES: condensation domain-containing protein [unclassified Micromonospora]MCW3818303.1 condensation domain-containing protein [Micromonospora sp. DR5-3]TYC21178.1 condensation protein [Micromonospora sp. MP36]
MTITPEAPQAPTALSLQQQFLCLFAQGFEAGPFGPHYVEVGGWRLHGRVDAQVLRLALADVVERHEALRTVLHLENGGGTQSVLPARQPELQLIELDGSPGVDRDRRAEQLMIEAETRPFPIDEVPLLRAVLGRFDEQDSVLVLCTHHSAADVWSLQVILRDLAECYAARVAGDEPQLPEVTQYRDYIAAQQEEAAGPTVAAARAYWRETLRGARILVAPTRRDEQVAPATSYHRFTTDAHLSAEVSRLARETRSSPFMVLLAAFAVFVNRRTQATDIVVPTFAPGRQHRFQSTVGSFFNFLPLRVDLRDCRTFRDVVARTRTACVGAFKHELPLLHVLAEAPELMASVGPDAVPCLFQAVQPPYLMQGKRIGDLEYTAIWRRVMPQPVGSETPDGMIWSMHLSNTEVVGGLSFSRHLFDRAEIEEQVAGFLSVIGEMVADPDSTI